MRKHVTQWVPLRFLALVGTASLLNGSVAWSQGAESDPDRPVSIELPLSLQYDSNISLASGVGPGEEIEARAVVHARPKLRATQRYQEHVFQVEGFGDLRKGLDSSLSEANLGGSAFATFNFSGGLGLTIRDDYDRSTFDQALFFDPALNPNVAEPGVSEVRGNTIGASLVYAPQNRFRVEGSHFYRHEDYVFDDTVASPDDTKRDHKTHGRVHMPVTTQWITYGDYRRVDQTASIRKAFEYESNVIVAGFAKDDGALRPFAEAGYGRVDFHDTRGVEFSEAAFRAGFSLEQGNIVANAAAGRDVYRLFVFDAGLVYRMEEDMALRLRAVRNSQVAFSGGVGNRVYAASFASADWEKRLRDKINLGLGIGYFVIDDRINPTDQTTVLQATVGYALTRWFEIGSIGRYATRRSEIPTTEFNDTRAGLIVTFRY